MAAQNAYGKCADSSVWLTRDPNANAVGDTFKGIVSNFPYVGGIVAGLVPDTYTANAVRTCPGATVDHVTPYTQEYILLAMVVVLIFVYLFVRK